MDFNKYIAYNIIDQYGNKKDIMPEVFSLLYKRDYSVRAFEQKLIQKDISPDDAKNICVILAEKGYLNDERYALRVTEIYYEKYGIRRVENELFKRGLASELAKKITKEYYDKERAVDHIYIEIKKILNSFSFQKRLKAGDYDSSKEYRRILGKFYRLGYTISEIKEAMSKSEEFNKDMYIEEDENYNDE
ncbi:MAG: RecX family [Clostridia bacterium]|nr:RecX family [Clostridia bacterium]